MSHLSRDARIAVILDATSHLIATTGFETLTMSGIASAAGISRQMLYTYFHSVDQILLALFEKAYLDVIEGTADQMSFDEGVVSQVLIGANLLFELPLSIFRIFASASFAGPHDRPAQLALKEHFVERVQVFWVAPLVEAGVEREEAVSGVYAIFSSILQFRELIDLGVLSREVAHAQVVRMADALVQIDRKN